MQTLDIDLLRTFVHVARVGRFKLAAADLNKSTSAVSVQIQRLEDIVGERLFTRDNRHVSLSARGRWLLPEARRLLAEHDRIASSLRTAGVSGQIRFGIPEEYASRFIESALPRFVEEFPDCELVVDAASSDDLAQRFAHARLDAIVTVEAEVSPDAERVGLARPVWAASRDLSALSDQPLPVAMQSPGCPYRRVMEQGLKEAALPWRTVVSSASSSVLLRAVERGAAVAIVASSSLTDAMRVVPAEFGLPALQEWPIVFRSSQAAARQALLPVLQRFFRS